MKCRFALLTIVGIKALIPVHFIALELKLGLEPNLELSTCAPFAPTKRCVMSDEIHILCGRSEQVRMVVSVLRRSSSIIAKTT